MVVTHHMPSEKCVSPRFVGSPLNVFFHSNFDDFIIDRKPKLWLSGHTHDPYDFMIGETRLVCHPRAYPSERPVGFEYEAKIIEI